MKPKAALVISPRLLLNAAQLGPLTVERRYVLEVADAVTADGLMQWPTTRPLIEKRLGPTSLQIAGENVERLTERLRELGITFRND